jgi:hypothetical protein
MSEVSRIRVSDADRHGVINRLQDATSEGRLSLDELGDRISEALTARTWSDLDPLTDDLPAPHHPEHEPEEEVEAEAGPVASTTAARAASATVLALGALSVPVTFYTGLGTVLGLGAVFLGALALMAPGESSRANRFALLIGIGLGLMPAAFFTTLFVIFGA